MAKALEDTTFYRYNRLIALNEVGGEPNRFGAPLSDFHAAMEQRQRRQAAGLSATSTHDTKRGEDARARLYVLSEMPEAWAEAVDRWAGLNAALRADIDGISAPDPEAEWMFYQALAGALPFGLAAGDADALDALAERLAQFMLKAVREAKVHTSWTGQNESYETAIESFTRAVLDPTRSIDFLQDFLATCEPVFLAGALNSLSQTAIKLTAPGIPDIYQGAELWDLTLVDPDNRRPIDFDAYQALQNATAGMAMSDLLRDWRSGAIKLRLIEAVLTLRQRATALFAEAQYVPLTVEGTAAQHAIAFARVGAGNAVVTIAPRACLDLLRSATTPLVPAQSWGETVVELPESLAGCRWRNVVTGGMHAATSGLAVGEALRQFPVAILANEDLQ